jgi:hypothetical protein
MNKLNRLISGILVFVFATNLSFALSDDSVVQTSMELFDRLPVEQLMPLLQLQSLTDPARLLSSLTATGANGPKGIIPPIPNEIVALIKIASYTLQIFRTFKQFKEYWEQLYGAVEYLKTYQFWLAQIIDPLAACLPKDGLYKTWPPDPRLEEIKEFLQYIAGNRNYWECSPELKSQLLDIIGGIPYLYDENGNIIQSPSYTRRTWKISEQDQIVKQVSAGRKAVRMMVAEADRLQGTIFNNENVPKNTAIAAGHILRAQASMAQLELSSTGIRGRREMDFLAAQKSLEEASSASVEAFKAVPKILITRRDDQ